MKLKLTLVLLLVAQMAATTACNDDPTAAPDHAEEVAAIRLSIDQQVVTVDEFGVVTGGPISVGIAPVALSATFLDPDGEEIEVHDDEFRLDFAIANEGVVTFARTGAFSGTLTPVALGGTTAEVSLFHLEEGHADFGPFDVAIQVAGGAARAGGAR